MIMDEGNTKELEMLGPDPNEKYPIKALGNKLCFIKNIVHSKNCTIGDYTYYYDPLGTDDFEKNCIVNIFEHEHAHLRIGKFTCIAPRTLFILDRAYMKLKGSSSYPFQLFEEGWENAGNCGTIPWCGDIEVGNDVFIGAGSILVPGAKLGDGAVLGPNSTLSEEIPPYTMAGGSPARPVRKRFKQRVIDELISIRWWEWDSEKISRNISAIMGTDINQLKNAK